MTFVVPLAVAAAIALVAAFSASKKVSTSVGPQLPGGDKPGDPSEAKKAPAGASPANVKSAPAGSLPAGTTAKSGDTQVVHADDTFDEAVAKAIANHDLNALIELAKQAEAKGLYTVAKSIRDEIARLQQAAGTPKPVIPTPPVPDKPPVTVPATKPQTLPTYIVKAGDTGEKIALAYTGNKSRWTELLAPTNPNKQRDPKYGIALYTDERINLPASWPAGVPVILPTPAPALNVPAAPPSPHTYTVVAGDTGEKVSLKFTGVKNRWTELVKVNPTLASAQYGIALYTGHKINLPASWPAVPIGSGEIAPVVAPPPVPVAPTPSPVALPPESDARTASRELTDYLTSIGGLAGRYKEDRSKVTAYQNRIGSTALPADGKYGRGTAGAIMANGLIPIAPYYWPSTNTQTAKSNFIALVKNYAAADPQRKAQWDKLLADTQRS